MNWPEILLSAAALVVAFAAMRRSNSSDPRREAHEAAVLQAFQEMRSVLETLPGRIADEMSASPLREAMEGVRESLGGLREAVGDEARNQKATAEELAAGIRSGMEQVREAVQASGAVVCGSLDGLSTRLGEVAAATAKREGAGSRELEEALRQGIGSLAQALESQSGALRTAISAEGQKVSGSVAEMAQTLGRIQSGTDHLAQLESLASSRQAAEADLARSMAGLTEEITQRDNRREAAMHERRSEVSLERQALVRGLEGLEQKLVALDEAMARRDARRDEAIEKRRREVGSEREVLAGGLSSLERRLESLGQELPAKIAIEIAARPAPLPELEELAIAVRESGHLRGDVGRQVADAVSRVGSQLQEAGQLADESRQRTSEALDQSMAGLQSLADALRSSLEPLAQALSSHGQVVVPLVEALGATKDRMEEASSTFRANQVEFAASVDVFSRSAQDLGGGLSAFAREGEREGMEDPRQAQKALLEALERLLSGFAESLKSHLNEADLRLREAVVELATRLPPPQA